MPVIGFLWYGSAVEWAPFVAAFLQGLKETGFVQDQNVTIDFRWTEGQSDRQAAFAADLVRRQVAVIVTGTTGGLAAKAETMTIPIVFVVGADPVKTGLLPGSTGPAATLPGSVSSPTNCRLSDWGCFTNCFLKRPKSRVLVNPKISGLGGLHERPRGSSSQARVTNPCSQCQYR